MINDEYKDTDKALNEIFPGDGEVDPQELAEMRAIWNSLDGLDGLGDADLSLQPPPRIQKDMKATARAQRSLPALAAILTIISVGMGIMTGVQNPTGPLLVRGGTLVLLMTAIVTMSAGLKLGGLSRRSAIGIIIAGVAGFSGLTVLQSLAVPNDAVPWYSFQCVGSLMVMAIPGVCLILWSLRGATLPTPTSGALLGAGIGFFSATVLHLHCAMISPLHLLIHHGGGLIIMAAIGAIAATIMMRRNLEAKNQG